MPDHTDNLHNKIVQKLAVEGKEHLLPPGMLPFLASLDSSSSDYNEGYLQALTQGCEIALERWGRQFARQFSLNLPDVEINLKKEMVAQLYTDFSRGIMYAAKHFDRLSEGSEIHQIRKIVITDAPESRVDTFGFASEDGKTVGMFPQLISMYNHEYVAQMNGRLKGKGRIFEDHKIPGKFFNAREMAFMTGIEEAVHAQQLLKGRFKGDYFGEDGLDAEAYSESESELEAAAVQQQAAEELGMGSTFKDAETTGDVTSKSPKLRAAERRKAMKKRKHGRG